MKVIDLLNMISKGEEVPKKVKAGYYYYEYEENGEYINVDDTEDLLFDFDDYFPLEQSLNQDIEIIEEDKKIEKIKDPKMSDEAFEYIKLLKSKQDEIIDYINGSDK